jgi:glycine/D-amino acid oxidase-like deaminating enzyme
MPKDEPIIIVGAGIFGLSTAIHLLERGYQNVSIFDKQDYDETEYSYFKGCDAASAGESIELEDRRHLREFFTSFPL